MTNKSPGWVPNTFSLNSLMLTDLILTIILKLKWWSWNNMNHDFLETTPTQWYQINHKRIFWKKSQIAQKQLKMFSTENWIQLARHNIWKNEVCLVNAGWRLKLSLSGNEDFALSLSSKDWKTNEQLHVWCGYLSLESWHATMHHNYT